MSTALLTRDTHTRTHYTPAPSFAPGAGSIAIGDQVRVRGDRAVWTITNRSTISGSFVLTLERRNLITGEHTTFFTHFGNVTAI